MVIIISCKLYKQHPLANQNSAFVPFSFCCFSDITEFKQTCWVSIWCRQWADSVQYQRLVARFILSNLSLNLFIPMQTNYFGGRGYIGITLSDRLSACVFFPITNTYETFYSCNKHSKDVHEGGGSQSEISMEIISCEGQNYHFFTWHSFIIFYHMF